MTSHIARLATRSVRYLEAGGGRPLVLLHAFPFSADQWLPQLARVPSGWRFIAPDLRGFGGAPPTPTLSGATSIDTYAADVLELMAHLDVPRAVVCGLSMGGYVAMALARKAPAKLVGLVLADTRSGADLEDGRAARNKMLDDLVAGGPPAVADAMLPKLLGPRTAVEQPDLADALRRLMEANDPAGIATGIVAMRDRADSESVLKSLSCPALVLVGADDAITPVKEAEALQEALAGSSLVILPHVGHMSNLEAPTAFNAALADWLGRLPRAEA